MKDKSIEAVVSRLKSRYHLEVDIYTARENVLEMYRRAKKMPRLKKIAVAVTDAHGVVSLPEMESVISAHYYKVPPEGMTGIAFPQFGMEPFVIHDTPDGELQEASGLKLEDLKVIPRLTGDYAPFRDGGNYLEFNQANTKVIIVYSGMKMDARRMPVVPAHLFDAAVIWLLFCWAEGEMITGTMDGNRFQYITQLKDRALKAATKMPNRNEADEILNDMVSFNRKSFGKSQ